MLNVNFEGMTWRDNPGKIFILPLDLSAALSYTDRQIDM